MKNNVGSIDPVVLGIIGITVVIFAGIVISANISKGTPIENYKIKEKERPALEISENNFDFGRMKLNEIKTENIEIKNVGLKPLVLFDAITSCDCTFAQFVIDGHESKKFSMSRDPNWRGEIQPNAGATLKIIYEPRLMPAKGDVGRSVLFKTNDPQNSSVTINFKAYIE